MSFRDYLSKLEARGDLIRIHAPISKDFEIAALLKQLEPRPVLFEKVAELPFRVAGNLFCGKSAFADSFDIPVSQIIPFMTRAIENRSPGRIVEQAPCQEVISS